VQTKAWLEWYNAQPETRAIPMDAEEARPPTASAGLP
jgi:ribosome biogenesis GTPase A